MAQGFVPFSTGFKLIHAFCLGYLPDLEPFTPLEPFTLLPHVVRLLLLCSSAVLPTCRISNSVRDTESCQPAQEATETQSI